MARSVTLDMPARIEQYQRRWDAGEGFGGAPSTYAHRYRAVADLLTGKPGLVLDCGCGPGALYSVLARPDYIGLDIVPEFIASARQRFPEARWLLGDMTSLPLATESVDYAVACTLFSYMPLEEARAALAEMVRVTRLGVMVLDNNFIEERDEILRALMPHGPGRLIVHHPSDALIYLLSKSDRKAMV